MSSLMINQVVGITYNAPEPELVIAKRCVQAIHMDGAILNIPQSKVSEKLQSHTLVVTFGPVATRLTRQTIDSKKKLIDIHISSFPQPKELLPKVQNKKNREETTKRIKELKQWLELHIKQENKKIEREDLENLDVQEVLGIIKGTENVYTTTSKGKLIEIGMTRRTTAADIFLTFEELLIARCMMDVLNVETVEIEGVNDARDNQEPEDPR